MSSAFTSAIAALQARDWDAAWLGFTQAAEQSPAEADPWIGLARVHRVRGDDAAAIACLRSALERAPDHPDALNNLAQILRAGPDLPEAAKMLARASRLKPQDVTIFLNAMSALNALRRWDDAIALAQAWIVLNPTEAVGLAALSEALLGAQRRDEAIAAAEAATTRDPYQSGARLVQAQALNLIGHHAEAVSVARLAFSLRGGDHKARLVLAECLASDGQATEALSVSQLACAARADDPAAQIGLARAAFLADRYDLAWPAYEHRFAFAPTPPPWAPCRPWRGEDVNGKTIVLVGEQGVGDTIHFARYAWEIVARGGRALLHVQEALAPLFSTLPQGISYAPSFNTADVDAWAPLLSAPSLLGLDAPMPPPPGYLRAPPHRSRPAALAGPGFKVGLAWAGNPIHPNDRLRSMPLAALAPLLETPGVLFFSLQVGAPSADVSDLGWQDCLTDLAPALPDWGHTAAAVQGLDLIITVDTAVAHLAAALGRPTWMLTAKCPDWRWGLRRSFTPWYPSMKLYRQTEERCWKAPVAQAAMDLGRLVSQAAAA